MVKVLVVDDEKIIREGIVCMLAEAEWIKEIRQAADGFAALEILQEEKADVVVVDILMPEMDGLELIARVKEKNLCENFVILSGYAEFTYAQQAIIYDVSRYLLKPVDQRELLEALRDIWERQKEVREGAGRKISAQELIVKIREERVSKDEIQELTEHILRLSGDMHPQSQRVKMLFEFILTKPEAEKFVPFYLQKIGFQVEEAAAVALYHAMRHFIDRKEHPSSVRRALLFIVRECMRERFSLTYAAGQLFMNANYLSGLVSHAIGISFNTFVRLLRVSKAQELLKREDVFIQKIGGQCGFGNMNLFFRSFRDVTGMTPTNYRREGI